MQISFNLYNQPALPLLTILTNQELHPTQPHSTMLHWELGSNNNLKGSFFFFSVTREIPSSACPDVNVAHVVLKSSLFKSSFL